MQPTTHSIRKNGIRRVIEKSLHTLLFLFLLVSTVHAQPLSKNDSLALSIPQNLTGTPAEIGSFIKENFSSDSARVRAIFIWVANNINYDVAKLNARDFSPQTPEDILKTRKAICLGYSVLFNELCKQCNVETMLVAGYCRQKGTISGISHAWSAVNLDQGWYLFDPTWAAGYVENNNFTKKYSNTYYKVPPYEMIKDHMPFDPVYQFSDHLITNKEFIAGKGDTKNIKSKFNFSETLQNSKKLSKEQQLADELARIESMGVENDMIGREVEQLKGQLEYYSSKRSYEQSMELYSRSVSMLNKYIAVKNKAFKEVKTDNDLKQMIDSMSMYIEKAWSLLGTAVPKDNQSREAVSNGFKLLEKLQNRVSQEKEFVTTYIRTDKNDRIRMFSLR